MQSEPSSRFRFCAVNSMAVKLATFAFLAFSVCGTMSSEALAGDRKKSEKTRFDLDCATTISCHSEQDWCNVFRGYEIKREFSVDLRANSYARRGASVKWTTTGDYTDSATRNNLTARLSHVFRREGNEEEPSPNSIQEISDKKIILHHSTMTTNESIDEYFDRESGEYLNTYKAGDFGAGPDLNNIRFDPGDSVTERGTCTKSPFTDFSEKRF